MTEKKQSMSKKRSAIIIGAVAVILAIVWIVVIVLMHKGSQSPEKVPTPIEKVIEYLKKTVYAKKEPEDLGNPNSDVDVMILNCDSTDVFETMEGIVVCNKEGRYVQGTGSFGRLKSTSVLGKGVLKEPVDISDYRDGSVHISLYVDDVSKLQRELWLELSSSGKNDLDEISFCIPRTVMKDGWNEFYLSISDARVSDGEPDLTKINFFRLSEADYVYGAKILYDNIYATKTKGVRYNSIPPRLKNDAYTETKTARGKMIMSCNTVNILEGLTNAEVTTEKSKYVEGTGAFKLKIVTSSVLTSTFLLKNPVDISDYKDGAVHVSFYVNDPALLTSSLNLELTSSGTYDKDEYCFTIQPEKLSAGWNHFWLDLSSSAVTGSPDLRRINFIRVWSAKPNENLELIMDDLYATMDREQDEFAESSAPDRVMIASCNTINIFRSLKYVEVTTKKGEYVEGTGAMKTLGSKGHIMEAVRAETVDISEYLDGFVHVSFYVNDVSLLETDVVLELSSNAAKNDVDEYQWGIKRSTLSNGWNECFLKISSAKVKGNMDPKAVCRIRIYGAREEGIVTIIDNICATLNMFDTYEETSSDIGKMIASCNTINIFRTLERANVTTAAGEFVEGTGALKNTEYKSKIIMRGILKQPVDISGYSDGYIHISFYVNDTDLLEDYVAMELSSNETDDQDEYQWTIRKQDLKNGWNECYLKISDAAVKGTVDMTTIKRIRIFGARKEGAVMIMDNICAVSKKAEEEKDDKWGPLF